MDNKEIVILAGKKSSAGGSGLSNTAKDALLDCFANVAWNTEDHQQYYDALEAALYPLDRITAVYTQSGTVYDTDSLDSLKADLVVTAFYQGGGSKTVTDYTLSGTLEAGTSEITVLYAGKTTTFNVTVTEAVVPREYQQVEWISPSNYNDSNIENSQYIDTGIVPTVNTGIIARIAATTQSPQRNIFGIRQSDTSADSAMLIQVYSSANKFGFARWGSAVQTAEYNNDFHDFELTASAAKVDNASYTLAAPASGQKITDVSFRIFGVYRYSKNSYLWQSGNPQKMTYLKILDGTTAVREFIPCYRKTDGVIGMWDRVTKAFFTNGGTGTFVKGSDVEVN